MVEYATQVYIQSVGGGLDRNDSLHLNALARDGWRVVASSTYGDRRLVYTLERELR